MITRGLGRGQNLLTRGLGTIEAPPSYKGGIGGGYAGLPLVKPKPEPVVFQYTATGEITLSGTARVALVHIFRVIGSGKLPILSGVSAIAISYKPECSASNLGINGEAWHNLRVSTLDEMMLLGVGDFNMEVEEEEALLGVR